ncbi:hypothetical protein GWI33_001758 [Rhynchophorus ferrugineus]|uniref:Uncharacterized protein n=1 Tax=Rhynchophorus ferrugineus TaxID=354439 RepID=A0A834IQ16_RHYFE|nr:hypothetical protein GWI33_001758 [Rhynchophorus ferrugineus]
MPSTVNNSKFGSNTGYQEIIETPTSDRQLSRTRRVVRSVPSRNPCPGTALGAGQGRFNCLGHGLAHNLIVG